MRLRFLQKNTIYSHFLLHLFEKVNTKAKGAAVASGKVREKK
jgi:hypothetical protein